MWSLIACLGGMLSPPVEGVKILEGHPHQTHREQGNRLPQGRDTEHTERNADLSCTWKVGRVRAQNRINASLEMPKTEETQRVAKKKKKIKACPFGLAKASMQN